MSIFLNILNKIDPYENIYKGIGGKNLEKIEDFNHGNKEVVKEDSVKFKYQ